jgi:Na+/citrate or Na+/malate symporter
MKRIFTGLAVMNIFMALLGFCGALVAVSMQWWGQGALLTFFSVTSLGLADFYMRRA